MTIQELSQELNISAQALRQWCKKNNVRKERTKGTKATYVLDCDTVEQARAYYLSESKESNERKETNQRKESNESKESNSETVQKRFKNDSRNDVATIQAAYIETLQAQIADLKADKQYLQERLTAAEQERAELTAERDKLTAERQTILAELLDLRAPKVIDVKAEPKAAASETSRTTSAPKQQPRPAQRQQRRPQKQSIFDRIFRRK
jgi:DNA-binding transcriptional MerR regulator